MDKAILFVFIICGVVFSEAFLTVDVSKSRVFDTDLYKRVIDSTECQRQIRHLTFRNTILLGQFLDAGMRFPKGVFTISVTDLGNYEQCLEINEETEDMKIEGKYAYFTLPFNQTIRLPFFNEQYLKNQSVEEFNNNIEELQPTDLNIDLLDIETFLSIAHLNFGICLPKACSLEEWIKSTIFNKDLLNIKIDKMFYRLPNDKPWVAADYVAIAVFSTLALITILSTLYDIYQIVIKKQDPKKVNIFYRTFSVYTNTRRLVTFTKNPNALDCLDGVRCISMMWVILGHAFQMHMLFANLIKAAEFVTSSNAIFISTAVFVVDSFFTIAGLLLVYTTVGKMSGVQLLKRLHVFYLNRLLRMFPLLAAVVLLNASVFHRISDGPHWTDVAEQVENCRSFWWTTLLHIQNYVNPENICIEHSWYIAIDIQLHIMSPLVLFWVLGKNKKAAWGALVISLLGILTGSTVFNFIKEFPSIAASLTRWNEQSYYLSLYYMNTLCRGSVFFIGMIVGYILNIYKGKELKLNMIFVIVSWIIALAFIGFCFYASYKIMQPDWNNQILDSLFNSFMRGIWAIGLCWIIFACAKGYGGPINWLLSLDMWKLPSRVSYAMYLYHYPIMKVYAGSQLQTTYFSVGGRMYDFLAFLMLTFLVSFVVTVVIDAPFSVLIKMAMEGGQRRSRGKENGSKNPGPLPIKDISDLGKDIITTLQKDPSIMEIKGDSYEGNGLMRNGKYYENTGAVFERNGSLIEKRDDKEATLTLSSSKL